MTTCAIKLLKMCCGVVIKALKNTDILASLLHCQRNLFCLMQVPIWDNSTNSHGSEWFIACNGPYGRHVKGRERNNYPNLHFRTLVVCTTHHHLHRRRRRRLRHRHRHHHFHHNIFLLTFHHYHNFIYNYHRYQHHFHCYPLGSLINWLFYEIYLTKVKKFGLWMDYFHWSWIFQIKVKLCVRCNWWRNYI